MTTLLPDLASVPIYDREDAGTQRRGDAEREPSQNRSTWSQAPEFIRGKAENFSLWESSDFRHGVSPSLHVSASSRPLQVTSDSSTASPITFDFAGNISANINFNPLVVGFVEDYFQVDLPTAWTITDKPFTGSFTASSDPAQYADGNLNIDFPLVADILGINPEDSFLDIVWSAGITVPSDVAEGLLNTLGITDVNSAVEFADKLLDFELEGSGTLTNRVGTTGFDIGYSDETNSIVIDGFDPNIVADSLIGQSTIAAQGTIGVNLVLSEFVEVTNTLGIDLPSNVDSLLATAQLWGINEIGLASGSFNFGVSTVPVSTVV